MTKFLPPLIVVVVVISFPADRGATADNANVNERLATLKSHLAALEAQLATLKCQCTRGDKSELLRSKPKPVVCPKGFQPWNRLCYYLGEELKTGGDAEWTCNTMGAELTNSRELRDWLVNEKMKNSKETFWVGGLKKNNWFYWNDWSKIDGVEEAEDQRRCLAQNFANSNVDPNSCNWTTKRYICEMDPAARCPGGFELSNDSCVLISKKLVYAKDAKDTCSQINATLSNHEVMVLLRRATGGGSIFVVVVIVIVVEKRVLYPVFHILTAV